MTDTRPPGTADPRAAELAERFAKWWNGWKTGASDTRVMRVDAAPSGFSNETWFMDMAWRENATAMSERVVLRIEPQCQAFFDDCDLELQCEVMLALAGSDTPVPSVLAQVRDPVVLGAPFYVMEFIPGGVASGRRPGFHGHGLFYEASLSDRETMWLAAVEAMAAVHRFEWRSSPLAARFGNPTDCSAAITGQIAQIESWLAQAATLGPFPVIEHGLEWLRNNPADYSGLSLLWGDARPGNLIYRGTSVAAVLDWEMAGIGPAEFDLFYFLLADEVVAELNAVPRLAGLPSRKATIAAWERCVGRHAENICHAEIFVATRFAALMALVVRLTPSGLDDPRALLTDNIPTKRLAALLARD